jgi:hypothetical protein
MIVPRVGGRAAEAGIRDWAGTVYSFREGGLVSPTPA